MLFGFFHLNLWCLDDCWLVLSVNSAELKAKIGVAMLLCEVFERFALVLPNSVRQSCVDDIFRDVLQILSTLKDIVKAIVLAVNGSKLINETIFLDNLYLLHEHFQFFECSQKSLVIISDTSPLIAIGVQKLSGAPWGLGFKVLD